MSKYTPYSNADEAMDAIRSQALNSWHGEEGIRRAERVEKLINETLENYSEVLKLEKEAIFLAIENNRGYAAVNYYQRANFPKLEKDVAVFKTIVDLKAAIKKNEFRCPSCHGVSTNPYECNVGKCDWKSYGLLRTLGQGFRCVVIEKFLEHPVVEEIFMPLSMEKAA